MRSVWYPGLLCGVVSFAAGDEVVTPSTAVVSENPLPEVVGRGGDSQLIVELRPSVAAVVSNAKI